MEVLGHRGSRKPGPENTAVAVDAALTAGADGIEVDVRRTADGDLVCVHDARLPRLGGRAVIRRSTAELAAKGVPTLHDVLDAWAGRGRIVVEIKNQPGQPDFDAPRERTAQVLVELLRARGLTGPDAGVAVSSFDWFAIELVRGSGVEVPTAFLTMPRMSVSGGLSYVRGAGHAELHAHTSAVLAADDAAERAHAAGIRLVTWTVTSERAALRLRDAGVDGIICDAPADVLRVLRASPPLSTNGAAARSPGGEVPGPDGA
jgi:glycerophosphoryl diester phosphodiesterase